VDREKLIHRVSQLYSMAGIEIREMGFETDLLKKIKQSRIFPTISKQYMSFKEKPRFYQVPFADVLPSNTFPDLMLFTEKK
jgi:hypothetical protein